MSSANKRNGSRIALWPLWNGNYLPLNTLFPELVLLPLAFVLQLSRFFELFISHDLVRCGIEFCCEQFSSCSALWVKVVNKFLRCRVGFEDRFGDTEVCLRAGHWLFTINKLKLNQLLLYCISFDLLFHSDKSFLPLVCSFTDFVVELQLLSKYFHRCHLSETTLFKSVF